MFTLYENPMFRHSIECWITVYALMTSGCIPNDIAHTISTTMAFQKKKKSTIMSVTTLEAYELGW